LFDFIYYSIPNAPKNPSTFLYKIYLTNGISIIYEEADFWHAVRLPAQTRTSLSVWCAHGSAYGSARSITVTITRRDIQHHGPFSKRNNLFKEASNAYP
jgi:hypothetical protein